ncbi:MAG: hypothetical protein AAF593_00410 [Planctomycetota bacterium]
MIAWISFGAAPDSSVEPAVAAIDWVEAPSPAEGPSLQRLTLGRPDMPRPIVAHVLRVDLDTPGLTFAVPEIVNHAPRSQEPPSNLPAGASLPDGPHIEATTATAFLKHSGADAVINAQGVTPWYDRGPLKPRYLHEGQPCLPTDHLRTAERKELGRPVKPRQAVLGFWPAKGDWPTRVVLADTDDEAGLPDKLQSVPLRIAGWQRLIRYVQPQDFDGPGGRVRPCTAFGLADHGRTLVHNGVPGRQRPQASFLAINITPLPSEDSNKTR